jgi:hypothetical protein
MHAYVAELLKLRTLRSTWGFVLVAVALAALFTAGNVGGTPARDRFEPDYQFRIVLDTAFVTGILALLLGIVLVTNEFRHGTISRALLATPRRGRFVATKLVTGGTVGVGLEVVALATAVIMAVIWLRALGVPIEAGDMTDAAWRAMVGVVLAGVLGAAVGGVVHSQVGALVGALVWIFVVEPLCWVLLGVLDWEGAADYLPAASLGGIVNSEGDSLPVAGAIGMTGAWIALAWLLALLRTRRRDIT